jgi:transcription initiation factor IIE alpha subunit
MIDIQEISDALKKLQTTSEDDHGATVDEISEHLGWSDKRVRKLLRKLHDTNSVIRGNRVDNNHYSGRRVSYTVYRIAD